MMKLALLFPAFVQGICVVWMGREREKREMEGEMLLGWEALWVKALCDIYAIL